MGPRNEVDSPPSVDSTPLPRKVVSLTNPTAPLPVSPSPDDVLQWIRSAGPAPWFPSAHARLTGVKRDDLDEPLNELRLAGLVRVATWARGIGQGYVLTPEGETASGAPIPAAPAAQKAPTPIATEPVLGDLSDDPPPIVTPMLVVANLLWFFVGTVVALRIGVPIGAFLLRGDPPALLLQFGAISAQGLIAGEWWRLITCCFVHVGVIHLAVNMFSLGSAGPLAEWVWGRRPVLVVYVLSGLAGSCLAMSLHPVEPTTGAQVVLAGASGAIWGVVTSLLAWLLLHRRILGPDITSQWARRLAPALFLNIAVSLLPGISWEAHLGGAVVGFLSAGLMHAMREGPLSQRVGALVLLLAIPGICVGGLSLAMKSGQAWGPFRPGPAVGATASGEAPAYCDRHTTRSRSEWATVGGQAGHEPHRSHQRTCP